MSILSRNKPFLLSDRLSANEKQLENINKNITI